MRQLIPIICLGMTIICIDAMCRGQATRPEDVALAQKDATIKAAREAYKAAVLAADQKYLATLDDALKKAMLAQDIESARRIDDAKKIVVAELAQIQNSNPATKESAPDADSTVFVCQGSGSMAGIDQVMRDALKKDIERLKPAQKFNVILFQDQSDKKKFRNLSESLIFATPANKQKAADFIGSFTFHGAKDPFPSLDEAFREQPQALCLMTDGTFNKPGIDEVGAKIAKLNVNHATRVNVFIVKGDDLLQNEVEIRRIETGLMKIADDNGGILEMGYPNTPGIFDAP